MSDKELRKAFEETTNRNVKMILDFSKETRRLVRELSEKVDDIQKKDQGKGLEIDGLRKQLTAIQVRLYTGGTDASHS